MNNKQAFNHLKMLMPGFDQDLIELKKAFGEFKAIKLEDRYGDYYEKGEFDPEKDLSIKLRRWRR